MCKRTVTPTIEGGKVLAVGDELLEAFVGDFRNESLHVAHGDVVG